MQENSLIRKLRLISKFMTSHTGKQMITINILPNFTTWRYISMISGSKGNKTIKFDQLIGYYT